ncbi:uncharacterized protein [Linepithema humile]|uniref:uncharacterized protein n=1 Tax=Linepithema humile TaxID=83485 RepID=UPI0006238859|nr:PREDICTED: uncharacterized protein LOC105670494 [Linepithema humile]
MKLLGYCILCLFLTRVQAKPQISKLFPVEGLTTYHEQLSNFTKPFEKFLEKVRTTYDFVFRQSDNTSYVEKILAKNVSNPDSQALKIIQADSINNYTNLRYPNNSWLDQIKSLSLLKEYTSKNSNSIKKNTPILEIKPTIKADGNNVHLTKEKSSNNTKMLPDDDWFNDIQPLGQLELQDEELDKKNEVEIVTPGTTVQLPKTVGRQFLEWLGSFFGLTYSIYTKLSSAVSGKEKVTQ